MSSNAIPPTLLPCSVQWRNLLPAVGSLIQSPPAPCDPRLTNRCSQFLSTRPGSRSLMPILTILEMSSCLVRKFDPQGGRHMFINLPFFLYHILGIRRAIVSLAHFLEQIDEAHPALVIRNSWNYLLHPGHDLIVWALRKKRCCRERHANAVFVCRISGEPGGQLDDLECTVPIGFLDIFPAVVP